MYNTTDLLRHLPIEDRKRIEELNEQIFKYHSEAKKKSANKLTKLYKTRWDILTMGTQHTQTS